MIQKAKRIKNRSAIDDCRKDYCEYCGGIWHPVPHHVYSVGSGAPDVPLNLINLCVICHTKAHNGQIGRARQLEIIAVREGMEPDDIEEKLYRMKRGDIE